MTLDCTLEIMDFLSQSDSFTVAEIEYYIDSLATDTSYSDVFRQEVPVNGYVYCKCKDRAGVVLRRKQDSYVKVSPVTFGRVKPINMEQYALSDALNDTSIQLLTVTGKAGTGKTLLTMAWAIDQITMKKGRYKRLVLTKPRVQTTDEGEPMGELPGNLNEKMAPQLASYLSAMGKIMGPRYKEWLELSLQNETIVVFPLEHMRGIDYSDSIVICDEVQNIGPNQYMTLATRINSSSRLILMGDVMQSDFYKYRDQPAFLSYATSPIYKRDKISAHVNLVKAERGPVPDLVLRIKESMDEHQS